jgi:hypothetical protein
MVYVHEHGVSVPSIAHRTEFSVYIPFRGLFITPCHNGRSPTKGHRSRHRTTRFCTSRRRRLHHHFHRPGVAIRRHRDPLLERLLKPGGYWINFGPLLYGTGPFVQLSLDEILTVVEQMGFEFQDLNEQCGNLTFEGKKVRWKEAEYGFNVRALTKSAYKAQAWVARKL